MRKTTKTAARGARQHAPRGRRSYLLDDTSRANCWLLGRDARHHFDAHQRADTDPLPWTANPFDWQPAKRLWAAGWAGKPFRDADPGRPMAAVELWGSEWAS